MALDDSANNSSGKDTPELAVKNRSRRIRKIKHSDDFEYNQLDDQPDDGVSKHKGKKRTKSRDESDNEFGSMASPRKAKRVPSQAEEEEDDGQSVKQKLADLGIELPKKPKGGYLAYITSIRESVVAKYPQATFGDLTHLVADAWNKLPQEEKKKYLDKAKEDKDNYFKELDTLSEKHGIDLRDSGKMRRRRSCKKPFTQKVRNVLEKNRSTMFARKSLTSEEKYNKLVECGDIEDTPADSRKRRSVNENGSARKRVRRAKTKDPESGSETDHDGPEDAGVEEVKKEKREVKKEMKPRAKPVELRRKIKLQDTPKVEAQIFTDVFLEINKGREAELRQLKKAVGDLEEQTVALRNHVTCLDESRVNLEENVTQHKRLNSDLSHYLVDLSNAVVKSFGKVKLPGCGELTHGNLGKYVEELSSYLDKGGKETQQLVKVAKGIAATLVLPS